MTYMEFDNKKIKINYLIFTIRLPSKSFQVTFAAEK